MGVRILLKPQAPVSHMKCMARTMEGSVINIDAGDN